MAISIAPNINSNIAKERGGLTAEEDEEFWQLHQDVLNGDLQKRNDAMVGNIQSIMKELKESALK